MTAAAGTSRDLASLVGTVLDGTYRLDQLIGEGGMGAVFRGRHVIMMRDVAIKVLHPDFNRDPELVRRFDREAQSAARLDHPNCIHVSAYGTTEDGMRYLVMQLLEGVELADLLTEPTAPKRVVEWSIQILRGLEHAHGQGVIHRDLKPQNVFLTRDQHGNQLLKLVDFGIAKLVGSDAGDPLTRAGMVFGTPQYMSPEQALGMEIDPRADLYAVGILMFQMLTGRLPFNHEDAIALIRMQVSTETPQLPDNVPQELAAIVYRLLSKQREQRFPDARTVRAALERYRSNMSHKSRGDTSDPLLDIGGAATTDTASRPLPEALRPRQIDFVESVLQTDRWSRRTWFKALIAGCVVLALASAGLIYWLLFTGPPAPAGGAPPAAESPAEAAPSKAGETAGATGGPGPSAMSQTSGPSELELAAIDDLIKQGKLDEAQTQIDALLERHPGHSQLVWRDARQLAKRATMHESAVRRYGEVLKKSPDLERDLGFIDEVDALLRKRPYTDAAIALAIDLGAAGVPILVHYINDAKPWATWAQRRQIRDALPADAAAQVDLVLNRRRDLEQYAEAPDPCAAALPALQAIQAEPLADYIPALKAAQPPAVPAGAPANPACDQAAALLATVRTAYAGRFPEAFAPVKPVKKKPAKKTVKKKRK
ncbi:serine/threonine-protein kinase [Nannocystis punicea]|uniref:Serine/threonine-protein kinase n=1 Tax=Nannocystis punicea TaxID=2995304 RepID=A0ABY7H257_9BACT|nr:serine/threonine-protein kinase [Nannocystis poenicansa]WAS93327.1 serine/threonine-protein kinase [Nannocystis poenicansa]